MTSSRDSVYYATQRTLLATQSSGIKDK